MRTRRRLVALALALLPAACSAPDEVAPAAPDPSWQLHGADFADGPALPLEALLAEPERWNGRELVVEGRVESVCAVKGCWMVLAPARGDAPERVRVRFLDYGFFVPKDCAGRRVRAKGVFAIETLSVEDARHLLEDAGRAEEARKVVAPVRELSFLASGVRLGP